MTGAEFIPVVFDAGVKALASIIATATGKAGINLLGKTGEALRDGTGNLTQPARNLLLGISGKYIERYAARHNTLRVLGMSKPVSLDSVYTNVNFHPDIIQRCQSLDAQEEAFRRREFRHDEDRPSMEVANANQYLMVLGEPGTGKSTFLRKVGLEALKGKKGDYQHTCIPVLLGLRDIKEKKIDLQVLEAKIAEEFRHCGLPQYQESTVKFLEQGRLLILLDGLDEVSTELMSQMTTAIRNLVDLYAKNRFIVSCRIAAYRNFDNFRQFTDVEVADFNDEQIKNLIDKWFESHSQSEWGQQCWRKLNSGDYIAAKELSKSPLLLTLICILFQKTGQFPTKQATLYERALRVLLDEWDAAKEIPRQQTYKGLDTKFKEVMLAEIAYKNFLVDNLFFQKTEIVPQIEQILQEMLPEEKLIDGCAVLRAIEEQHGILVKRYDDIYSFSHLTFQEFLTAKHIVDNNIDIANLVAQHLCDKSWHQVFQLLAGLRRADDLLLTIKKQIPSIVATPNLQALLTWVEKVTDTSEGEFKPLEKRAIALANIYIYVYGNTYVNVYANAGVNALINDKTHANVHFNDYAEAFAYAYLNAYAEAFAYAYLNIYAKANANAYALARANVNVTNLVLALAKAYSYVNVNSANVNYSIEEFIKYSRWSKEFQIYKDIDFGVLINSLEQLKEQLPDDEQPNEVHQTFNRRIIQIWFAAFHLSPEMLDLSKEEIEALNNYFYTNRLIVDCEKAAVRRSQEIWNGIEARMLLPTANF